MNQLLAAMLLLTVMLHAVVLLEMLRVLRLGLRQRPPTTEAAPSGGAASVGLPARRMESGSPSTYRIVHRSQMRVNTLSQNSEKLLRISKLPLA
jgi:hypothetical protein